MQTPAQRCARLVAALEDLASQEESSLRTGDFAAVESIQERAGAVIGDLASQTIAMADEALRARLRAVSARRSRSSEWLAGELERTRTELSETNASRGRVAKIAPVYGSAPAASRAASRLAYVG
ncbi:MAG: hypothetical protein V4773_17155 [Verrucomicrobiota bacterium]